MKAKYEKPELNVVGLELGTAIAGSCVHPGGTTLTQSENCAYPTEIWGENAFAQDTCTANPVVDYCYYTVTDAAFNS